MNEEKLMDVYSAYNVGGRRSEDCVMYEIHRELNIVRLTSAINSRDLAPDAYCFVKFIPRPREIFAGDMDKRLIEYYFHHHTRGLFNRAMTPHSYNCRRGFGPDRAVNDFMQDLYEVSKGFTEEAWVAFGDVKAFYVSIPQDVAYNLLRELVESHYHGDDKEDMLYILQVAIYTDLTARCRRRSPRHYWQDFPEEKSLFTKEAGRGGAPGGLIWQVVAGYIMNEMDKDMAAQFGGHYRRYTDDFTWAAKDKEMVLAGMEIIRRHLKDVGLTLHEGKFRCQRASAIHSFLHKHIHGNSVHSDRRVRRSAEKALKDSVLKEPTFRNVNAFLSRINSYTGIFRACNEIGIIERLADMLPENWAEVVCLDKKRHCFRAKEEYKLRLAKRYKLKYSKLIRHGDNRKNQSAGVKAA